MESSGTDEPKDEAESTPHIASVGIDARSPHFLKVCHNKSPSLPCIIFVWDAEARFIQHSYLSVCLKTLDYILCGLHCQFEAPETGR